MGTHLSQAENVVAEVTLGERVAAIERFMLDLLLFVDSEPASFANDSHEVAVVELVST